MISEIPMPEPVANACRDKRLALSRLAKNDMLAYALACEPKYAPAPFHAYLARVLTESIIKRNRRRVIINMPPRHGKSRLTAEEATSFLLGHRPDSNIVVASYASGLSGKASKAVRRRIAYNAQYRTIFPETRLMPDDQNAALWRTTANGTFQAVGVTGGLTGHGADLLIIDDPHKDRAEAESETMRERVWDWFVSTAFTRLAPDAVVVVIMTRWHKDDLVGRLMDPARIEELREAGADEEAFDIVNLPALSRGLGDPLGRPAGAPLWPQRGWSQKRLNAVRIRIGSYEWGALYCGDPVNRQANSEIAGRIKTIPASAVPRDLRQSRVWDLAVTDGTKSDYNAGARGGYHAGNDMLYITHMAHQKSRWLETKKRIYMLGEMDGPGSRIRLEAIGAFEALYDEVKKDRMGKNLVSMFKPDRDKVTRSFPWIAYAEAGRVCIVEGEWNRDFLDELMYFPNGVNDDQIDAVSGLWELTRNPGPGLQYG